MNATSNGVSPLKFEHIEMRDSIGYAQITAVQHMQTIVSNFDTNSIHTKISGKKYYTDCE